MTASGSVKEFFLSTLREDAATFQAAVANTELTAPVPPCPKWTVYDLVAHLGSVYHRQRQHLVRGETSRPAPVQAEVPEGAAVLNWFDEQYQLILRTLVDLAPEAPAWTWSIGSEQGSFWHRRLAQETAVHRWDAQSATASAQPVNSRLAADGVAEVLEVFLPAGFRKGPDNLDGVVRLETTDTSDAWTVRVRGTGLSLLDTETLLDPGPGAHTVVSGTASDLLLGLWGRIDLDVLTINGDRELLTALRTG
jgi:uncharacterized protein (TIGR03083 family)